MPEHTVSVIIPAYRSADTIVEALTSAVEQTYSPSEIIVIDDASPDDTVDVVARWIDAHESPQGSLHLIRQASNQGPAAARNAGIRKATGDWLAFLDADDAWLPQRLSRQFDLVSKHPDAGLVCACTVPLDETADTPVAGGGAVYPLALLDFVAHNPVATSTVLLRRSVAEAAGLFDEQFRGPEDYDFWMRVAAVSECLKSDDALVRYRHRKGSLSMDERTFLPEVLRVLSKAFADGGALSGHREWRRKATAEQYSSASWMAYRRGARMPALRYLLISWCCWPGEIDAEAKRDRWLRAKLLVRYLGLPAKPEFLD